MTGSGSAPVPGQRTSGVRVSIVRDGAVGVVLVAGELDLATEAAVRQATTRAAAMKDLVGLVLQLRAVSFCDVRGLAAVLDARSCAQEAGAAFALAEVPPALVRLLDITKLSEQLRAYPTLRTAVRAVGGE